MEIKTRSPVISVTRDEIDASSLIESAKNPDTGALVTFVGVVRDDGIEAMEVEAFEEVALADLQEIAAAAASAHQLTHVDIIHRIGTLLVGETILLIICGAGHRKEAFVACEEILERIKERVPIWKKEFREGGAAWVSGHRD
jgi:molybdopterin synthase catalytic subunit